MAAAHLDMVLGGAQHAASRELQRVPAEDRHLTGPERHRPATLPIRDLQSCVTAPASRAC